MPKLDLTDTEVYTVGTAARDNSAIVLYSMLICDVLIVDIQHKLLCCNINTFCFLSSKRLINRNIDLC